MKVAFELPYRHIRRLKVHQDFNFLLAHKVLDDAAYRQEYGDGGVLDNGQYELGEPLDIRRLHIAERMCKPEMVIAPDWLGERERTMAAYKEASTLLTSEVGGVVQGKDILDMLKCYGELLKEGCHYICLPFRLERVELMQLITTQKLLSEDVWYHFLGLKSMAELRQILALDMPYTSIDTSKPIKAALHNKDLDDDLRGLSVPWSSVLSAEQVDACEDKMKEFMALVQVNDVD